MGRDDRRLHRLPRHAAMQSPMQPSTPPANTAKAVKFATVRNAEFSVDKVHAK